MHQRGEKRLKLTLIIGISFYCQLGCASLLRVPSKEKMAHSWIVSNYRLLSLEDEGIQALPENTFIDFDNIIVSFLQQNALLNHQLYKSTHKFTHTSYNVWIHYEVFKPRQKTIAKQFRSNESADLVQRCTTIKYLFKAFKIIVIFPSLTFLPLPYIDAKRVHTEFCQLKAIIRPPCKMRFMAP